jgi:hypothetical protein
MARGVARRRTDSAALPACIAPQLTQLVDVAMPDSEAVGAPRAAASRGPLICYFSDTDTTVRLYVTSCTKCPKTMESDSPWKCSTCGPGLSGGREV